VKTKQPTTLQVGRHTLQLVSGDQLKPCGECRACCTALAVAEFSKPNYRPCVHECDQGCAIYPDRPDSCRTYLCLWKTGWLEGDERRRPDRLGVIFDWHGMTETLRVWEVWPGATQEPQPAYLIQKLRKKYPVLVWTEEMERAAAAEVPGWAEVGNTAYQEAERRAAEFAAELRSVLEREGYPLAELT
jgi:hypothetical protein